MKPASLLIALLITPASSVAQLPVGAPTLTEHEEVTLARSAAAPAVSSEATVLVLRGGRYETAQEGVNGVHCMVSRSQPLALEPICYDPEASRTVMRREIRLVELLLAGASPEEVDRTIEEEIESGVLELNERPAIAYMLSAGQVLYADAETRVGSWNPHVHFYWPYATAEMFGALATDPSGSVFISEPGEATASLIVIAGEFVEVGGGEKP